ncbi:MAG: apolipoprotein N-acyltransferase [Bacteroidales bacterium]|nr:apolipoprotein N-acyltransferase [Bacteroidales bacterium]
MSKTKAILLSVLSGIILSLGWYEWSSGLFLLITFVPVLFVEEHIVSSNDIHKKNSLVYLYTSISLFIWNVITTWWIKNASFAGLVAAVLVTTGYMSLAFLFYTITKRKLGRFAGYASLIIFWISLEFAYTHGEISWPWLTLGNGLLFDIKFIQWYEYTGVFGGSLWVLLVNIMIFELIRKIISGVSFKRNYNLLSAVILIIVIPVIISLIRFKTYEEEANAREIVVVQPNVDPYMKFNDMSSEEQTLLQVELAESKLTPETDYIASPETSILGDIWIGHFNRVFEFVMLRRVLQKNPGVKYVAGVWCRQYYPEGKRTPTARPYGNTGTYYDTYNSAVQIDSTPEIQLYHKSKLVTGVEKMPYPKLLGILRPLTVKLGGTFRSHAIQKERSVFKASDDSVMVAPVICYESVYGEFVGDYIKKGANIIFVITNDGWWGDTPGHRQHNALSCMRAIETRRSIARSANTGISSFINQKGEVIQKLTWWKRGAIRDELNINNKVTFYTKHGDYIGRAAFYLAILLGLVLIFRAVIKK